jgi:hypothetical protein
MAVGTLSMAGMGFRPQHCRGHRARRPREWRPAKHHAVGFDIFFPSHVFGIRVFQTFDPFLAPFPARPTLARRSRTTLFSTGIDRIDRITTHKHIVGPTARRIGLAFSFLSRSPALIGGMAAGNGAALVAVSRWIHRWERKHAVQILREPRWRWGRQGKLGWGRGRGIMDSQDFYIVRSEPLTVP